MDPLSLRLWLGRVPLPPKVAVSLCPVQHAFSRPGHPVNTQGLLALWWAERWPPKDTPSS